jgi:poly(hydroxyalkanoate) depolymerase family esterase
VGTTQSLTHDGGGDTEAIVQMVKYTLEQYDGDASRVYVLGGSSGAMMTQALMAVYPDVFRAGSARAGVPAGCWADGFAASNQWSNNCANGTTTKSAQQWGDQARGMYPDYMGHRPRIQIFHGTADQTIKYPNFAEAIKQWTNVLELETMPSSTDSVTTPVSTYQRQFWKNECGHTVFEAWAGQNGSHSMAYEQDAILEFFGLDEKRAADPEAECPPGGGTGGMGGMGGMGGVGGASGSGSSGESGIAGTPGMGGTGPGAGSGGVPTTAGTGPTAGTGGTGTSGSGPSGSSGTTSSGGMGAGGSNSAGSPGAGGITSTAGSPGTGASSGRAGNGASGSPSGGPMGTGGSAPDAEASGCAFSVGPAAPGSAYLALLAASMAFFGLGRRRRSR